MDSVFFKLKKCTLYDSTKLKECFLLKLKRWFLYSPPKGHAFFQETGVGGAYLFWGSQNSASGSCAEGLLARPKKDGEARRPACDSDLFYLAQPSREVSLPGQEGGGGGRLWKRSPPVGPLGRSGLGPPWRQEEAHPGFLCFPYQGAGPCCRYSRILWPGAHAESEGQNRSSKQDYRVVAAVWCPEMQCLGATRGNHRELFTKGPHLLASANPSTCATSELRVSNGVLRALHVFTPLSFTATLGEGTTTIPDFREEVLLELWREGTCPRSPSECGVSWHLNVGSQAPST